MLFLILLIIIGVVIIYIKYTNQYKIYKDLQKNNSFKENILCKEAETKENTNLKYNSYKNNSYCFQGKLNNKILTYNELRFYYKLKAITDKYDLYIFPKIRMADLIKTEDYANFNKIKCKHIDFTICNKRTEPILFIELDDTTHNSYKVKQNDIKKDYIMETLFKEIIRVEINKIDEKLIYIDNILKNEGNSNS